MFFLLAVLLFVTEKNLQKNLDFCLFLQDVILEFILLLWFLYSGYSKTLIPVFFTSYMNI